VWRCISKARGRSYTIVSVKHIDVKKTPMPEYLKFICGETIDSLKGVDVLSPAESLLGTGGELYTFVIREEK
jgi:hypothetical protein